MSAAGDLWRGRVADEIAGRALADGTFPGRPGEPARVDATAWAACALAIAGKPGPASAACERLAAIQGPDGRIASSPLHPGASWPTPAAILAWRANGGQIAERERAVAYLLNAAGQTMERDLASPVAIDSSIPGWPWVERTFGWVAPTAHALLALECEGRAEHARCADGRRLLLDRQLPSGGWNYGNTLVFGAELLPAPEESGPALAALAGRVAHGEVAKSLAALAAEARRVRTPLTLSWAILALSAWRERPEDAGALLERSLEAAERFGGYDTAELALLLLAALAPDGIVTLVGGTLRGNGG